MLAKAILALADGMVFHGRAVGASGTTVGELVFNTAMTGYQEIISDPSYARQIVVLTSPHVGIVGANVHDEEAERPRLAGLVMRQCEMESYHFHAQMTLSDYLLQHHIIAIDDIDTRQLTKHLREHGAQNACLMAGDCDEVLAIQYAKQAKSLAGLNVIAEVTRRESFSMSSFMMVSAVDSKPLAQTSSFLQEQSACHVVVYDFGVKQAILRLLAAQGCRLTIVPSYTTAKEALALKPDGIFLSNGPGDPAACHETIQTIQTFLAESIPLFGLCLGHQLLALAAGAKTVKMKFGHHGANHPVMDMATGKIFITSQNHGFTVDEKELPANILITHRSLFDDTIQGIKLCDKPVFGFQGHPEAAPGPQDLYALFHHFIQAMTPAIVKEEMSYA